MDYLRIRAIPFNESTNKFLQAHAQVFVIEGNRDGQMKNIIAMNFPDHAGRLVSISHIDGLALSAEWIMRKMESEIKDKSYGR